jgi:very-short-patch-repair endonuclease
MRKSTYEAAKELARELRKRQTPAEEILWKNLRNRQFLGNKFLRQHPIFFYYGHSEAFFIADFYCREYRLVIEIDGASHEYQKEYDKFRTHIINDLGVKVVRFKNDEIERDLHQVLERLKEAISL